MLETRLTALTRLFFLVLTVVLISGCLPARPSATASPVQPIPSEPTATRLVAAQPIPQTGQGGPVYLPLVQHEYPPSPDWAQLAGNPQHTGYVAGTIAAPRRIRWIWNGPAGGGDAGPASDHLVLPSGVQPISGDGRLYLGASDGVVRALAEADGRLLWSSPLGGAVVNTGAFDPATHSLYFGAADGKLYRLDAVSGTILGSFAAGGRIEMAPLLVEGTVYIGTTSGTLYAVDKSTLTEKWRYAAGAALLATPAYSSNHGGLVILEAEDKSVHALQAVDGSRRWRVTVNAYRYDTDDKNDARLPAYTISVDNRVFFNSYPVISEVNDVVIIRSYLPSKFMFRPEPTGVAPSTVPEIRSVLTQNPRLQSFFVLKLDNGQPSYVAPVMVGAIGDGDFESVPPQAVVKRLPDGSEVAYLAWRSRQACYRNVYDGVEDTTLGEMDLRTGNIRFLQSYKNEGVMRLPTDEQSPLSMAGDWLFQAHWMTLGSLQITDRSPSLGDTYANPIRTREGVPILNTLAAGSCPQRANHFCPLQPGMYAPGEDYLVKPGSYVYYFNQKVYDLFAAAHPRDTVASRSAVIHGQTVYWRTVDGAIVAYGP